MPPPADRAEILEAVRRAKAFKLCLRRVWAVAASLPDRAKSLPTLIPPPDMFPVPNHNRPHHDHEQCTFDFCEHSRVDFTSMAQHHECRDRDCKFFDFPLQLLDGRVKEGKPTAWKLHDVSFLSPSRPYMAVSHVWADGTGVGIWRPGLVNKCLYTFFSDIAQSFQCEGCWWDTISIPLNKEARNQALNNMQNYYADARVTLVHDLYLREWEWVDAETACFAIVMSPWYSRGWTSLELAKSHKVKILFKARNNGYVIKDLDVDILANIQTSSRHHPTAESIRKLRSASVQSFGDLLAILGPRDTSKPRDVPIISGLLAGIDVSGGLSQQEIYQRILRKLGKIAQGHLFHNSATMSAPAFSWCPTNILDMPMAGTRSTLLELQENGDLEGVWRVYPIDVIKPDDFIWKGTHPLTQVFLESALEGKTKEKHLLLFELGHSRKRALLVRLMRNGKLATPLCCHFVGPVFFRSAPDGSGRYQKVRVRIGSTEKMQELPRTAWDFVCSIAEVHNPVEKAPTLDEGALNSSGTPSSQSNSPFEEDQPTSMNVKDWRALFYLERVSKSAFEKIKSLPVFSSLGSKNLDKEEVLICPDESDISNSHIDFRAFFYGNRGMIPHLETWLKQYPNPDTKQGMLLALDEDNEINVDLDDIRGIASFATKALHFAISMHDEIKFEPLVTLLLDNYAQHSPSPSGNTPLHLTVEYGYVGIVENLLANKKNPADADEVNNVGESALHIAAKNGYEQIVELLIGKSESLNAQVNTLETALHLAARNGHLKIVRLLLEANADANIGDLNGQRALHYAASGGHDDIVQVLLINARNIENQKTEPYSYSSMASRDGFDGKTNEGTHEGNDAHIDGQGSDDSNQKSDKTVEDDMNGDSYKKSDKQTTRLPGVDCRDNNKQTALHLAAQNGHIPVVHTLLLHGAQVYAKDNSGQTALLLAAEKGRAEIVGILLAGRAFEEAELNKALLLAATGNCGTAVRKLHESGARSGARDATEMTALDWTIEANDEESAILLIENQDDLNFQGGEEKQSALIRAVNKGLIKIVAALVEKGAKVNLQDSKQRTALHWAAIRRHVDIIRKLLDLKSESLVNVQDYLKRTALHWAAWSGSTKTTELIFGAGAHLFTEDHDGRSALIVAAIHGRAAVVKTLLDKGSDPAAVGNDSRSALDWAATIGSDKVVRKLLPKIKVEKTKKRALELAANGGHLSVAVTIHNEIQDRALQTSALTTILFSASAANASPSEVYDLIENVADINQKDSQGRTALILAAQHRDNKLIHTLLTLNAMTNLQDRDGRTALMIATKLDHDHAVRLLLRSHGDIDIQDHQGRTALHYASQERSISSLVLLLQHGAKVDLLDSRSRTALHVAMEKLYFKTGDDLTYSVMKRYENVWRILVFFDAKRDLRDENGTNPLHWAVRMNRQDIAETLLDCQVARSLDVQDVEGRTPLLLAAERGYEYLVYTLLKFPCNPNIEDKTKRTPLLLAAERGDHESVRALLDAGADPNRPDIRGRTALAQASQNGHEHVVDILFSNEKAKAKPDIRDAMGRTALLLAAESGHASIVDRLLANNAKPTIMDYDGKKALQKAMDKGHASVVGSLLSVPDTLIDRKAINEALLLASRRGWLELTEVLLKNEADMSFQSKEGWTALHMAAMSGHQDVVKLLLPQGVSIIIRDNKNRTALMQATEHGFQSIVELLLKVDEVTADIDGWMGQEALLFAAEKGYDGIVELLLKAKVNHDSVDSAGRTAMALAAANGNTVIVELLLKREASSTIKDNHNRTALHHASWGGYDDVVKILLNGGVDFSVVDNRGQSALHLAAERASKMVVEQLVERRANANAKSEDGQTALHRAAWGGSHDVVTLLRRNGADPFIRDDSGNKPWQVAAEKGHESIVEVLLDEEKSAYDEHIMGKRGLIFAAQMGYLTIARSLLKRGAESSVKDQDGLTPLHWAMVRGDEALVDLLISWGRESIDALDNQRQTALCHGVLNGRAAVVEKLLQSNANANIPDENRRTVLHHAARNGDWEIAQILVSHKADPHVRDLQMKKAWQLAAEAGYHQIVRLLLGKEINLDPKSRKMEELFLQMAESGLVSMVQLLLEKGVNKDATDPFGRTAISLAAEHGKDEVVRLLLLRGADPSMLDLRLKTPLLWAAGAGNAKIISLLLNGAISLPSDKAHIGSNKTGGKPPGNGDNTVPGNDTTNLTGGSNRAGMVNHRDSEGRTALLVAVQKEYNNAVKLLLDRGAPDIDVDLPDIADRTALQLAAERGDQNLVRLLLQNKAETTSGDKLGQTALILAAEQGNKEVVNILLAHSPKSVDIPNRRKRTALQAAAERGERDIAEALLKNGADANLADDLGRTALLLAVENGDKDVVDLLLENGAEQERKDLDGRTPLLLAVTNGDRALVNTLLQHPRPGADVGITDSSDRSLLELATKSGNKDVLLLIAQKTWPQAE